MNKGIFVGVLLAASLFILPGGLGSCAVAADSCKKAIPAILRGSINLPAGCVFEQSITISESDTSLNCNGSVFDGKGKRQTGLLIDSQGQPLSNIKIEDCTFRNFKQSGVRITWSEIDARKGTDHQEIYARSPSNILLHKIVVEDNGGVGLFIDDYVTHVTVQDSVIQRSHGVGIYLEHSSKGHRIINNQLLENGYRFIRGPREAIAVDSSAENVIEGNVFKGNAAGGIFLYKNCGERISSGKQVVRWQHSSGNMIRNNRFEDEKIGIWLASRQSRNLLLWDCADKPMDWAGRYYEDFADSNTIDSNLFCHSDVGIRIESDNNKITNNRFDRHYGTDIEIPVTKREQFLQRPQQGNDISGGSKVDCRERVNILPLTNGND